MISNGKPIYPSPYMRITQGYMTGTHKDSYAIDDAGSDSGIDFIVAPFTGILEKYMWGMLMKYGLKVVSQ